MILVIYALCALTSLACAMLLIRGSRRAGSRMLFWCGLCFGVFAIANVVVILDHYVIDTVDLWPFRVGTNLVAVALLLYGLILEEH